MAALRETKSYFQPTKYLAVVETNSKPTQQSASLLVGKHATHRFFKEPGKVHQAETHKPTHGQKRR